MLQIHGVDTTVGMASTNQNEALYRKLLGKFCEMEGAFAAKSRELIAAGRADDLKRLAHDLHSTGAALGAFEVAELAASLETEVARGSEAKPLLDMIDNLESRLAPVLAAISAAIGASPLTQAISAMHRSSFMPPGELARAGLWR